jgi:hypothetical protein
MLARKIFPLLQANDSYLFCINKQEKTNLSYISALGHSDGLPINGGLCSHFLYEREMAARSGQRLTFFPNGQKSNNTKIFNSAAFVVAVRHYSWNGR